MGRLADSSGYTNSETALWNMIADKQDHLFRTVKGLEFSIVVKGNELFVSRRKKSITRASVNIAYAKWIEDPDCGPKALGVFGASYLWSIFRDLDNDIRR